MRTRTSNFAVKKSSHIRLLRDIYTLLQVFSVHPLPYILSGNPMRLAQIKAPKISDGQKGAWNLFAAYRRTFLCKDAAMDKVRCR